AFVGPSDAFRYRFATNQPLLRIFKDSLVSPGVMVSTDSVNNASVWLRDLDDGTKAVMLLNHKTNNGTSQAISINWTNVGWSSNQLVKVIDVLGDASCTGMGSVYTNAVIGFTRTVN